MKRILLPVDGSANALNAARYLVREFFGNPEVEVHLLNVRAPLSSYVTRYVSQETIDSWHRDEAEKALKPCRDLFDKHGLPMPGTSKRDGEPKPLSVPPNACVASELS